MGQSPSAYKGIDPSHVRVADSEGSLVLDFPDGARVVAVLPGSVMYSLGHYLRKLNMFEDLLIQHSQKISRPLPLFVPRDDYVPIGGGDDYESRHLAHTAGPPPDLDEVDLATIQKTKPISGDEETGSVEGSSEIKETQEEFDARLKQERFLHAAIKQRKIIRLVAQYPVQLSTPFVDEFYQRIVSEDSPYEIFDSTLITVYRLWSNTGSHRMFLIRGIQEFLKSKNRLGILWHVNTLETFMVCSLYTEYDMVNAEIPIEKQDYYTIETRMMNRLRQELSRVSQTLDPPPEGASVSEEVPKEDLPMDIMEPEYDSSIPEEVYYMQKREELEIRRMGQYYDQKNEILNEIYSRVNDFDRVSNPFYERLHNIQRRNETQNSVDRLMPQNVEKLSPVSRITPYRAPLVPTTELRVTERTSQGPHTSPFRKTHASTSSRAKEAVDPQEKLDPDTLRHDHDLLQHVLESILAANESTLKNWSEYMECTRKILIEVRDIVRQVQENKKEAEILFAHSVETPPKPTEKVAKSAESGADDVEARVATEHATSEDILNAKIVWGHGIPLDEENGKPIGPYSPDKPHLPLTTLERLECLLDATSDCLVRSLQLDENQYDT